jgi:hypothetical protein
MFTKVPAGGKGPWIVVGAALVLAAFGAACSSSAKSSSGSGATATPTTAAPVTAATSEPTVTTPETTAAPTSPPTTVPQAASVGSAIAFDDRSGNKGTVTLAQVIDPAQTTNSIGNPEAGKRLIGVKFVIAATAGIVNGNANVDSSLEASNNQTYKPTFNDIAGCTNFDGGDYSVTAGRTATGCVTFELATALKVAYVRFSPGYSNSIAEWKVP